ncbi:PREDICTED: uncharacterized protein LOC105854263 [Condylura cristata]|uniref:uncharacterized protein LOC105854263 n=1 Tax=Condylura cristata TaxID=143302 RepID=UPI00064376E2|nr:PREDICTED: uncharacterized protein LOC105854263 [Condylura cristata]
METGHISEGAYAASPRRVFEEQEPRWRLEKSVANRGTTRRLRKKCPGLEERWCGPTNENQYIYTCVSPSVHERSHVQSSNGEVTTRPKKTPSYLQLSAKGNGQSVNTLWLPASSIYLTGSRCQVSVNCPEICLWKSCYPEKSCLWPGWDLPAVGSRVCEIPGQSSDFCGITILWVARLLAKRVHSICKKLLPTKVANRKWSLCSPWNHQNGVGVLLAHLHS